MTDTLGVAVNRDGLHTLDVPETFEASGPFDVELQNHGEATHLYLNLDDSLSEIARIEATNHYVEADERRTVEVQVRDPGDWPGDVVRGNLKVVAAHGQETHFVEVVFDRTRETGPVEVDPELSKPQAGSTPGAGGDVSELVRVVPVGVLGAVALILAIGALMAADGINFVLGAFSVLAGGLCAMAAYYLLV